MEAQVITHPRAIELEQRRLGERMRAELLQRQREERERVITLREALRGFWRTETGEALFFFGSMIVIDVVFVYLILWLYTLPAFGGPTS